ncbi:MAG: hypothetical protein ACLGPL_06795 [Acidobacteriota bacterium]
MENLSKIFSDNSGNPSSMRLFVAIIVSVVLGTWSFCCIKSGAFIQPDLGFVGTLVGVLGVQQVQKRAELKAE